MSVSKPANASPAKKVRRKRRKTGRGTLWVIAVMLAMSGVVRLGAYSQAIAREVTQQAGGLTDDATAQPLANCGSESDIAIVLERLSGREAKLVAREAALEDRLQAMAIAEIQIERNMSALIEAEVALESTMALADSAAEDDLKRLTAVYENMKPKEAAPLFAEMDPKFAAGFLGRMRADAAAAIMAGLEPQIAYTISVILAGRNANVPTN